MMLVLYSYCTGVFSSRKIAARCETDVAFRAIVGEEIPDFRTISEYRRRHLSQFQHLFVEVLRLCREAGLVKVGRQSRLKKIREAKAALDEQARAKAAADESARQAEGKPPSKTDQANDVRQVQPMLDQTIDNMDRVGITENMGAFTADAGYFSEENVTAVEQEERVDEVYIATGRLKHHEQIPAAPKGRIPNDLSPWEKMARKLRTKKGRAEYARRKAIVEPPFGQIKHCRGYRQFLLRGLKKMSGEWNLVTLTHNLLKLFRSTEVAFH